MRNLIRTIAIGLCSLPITPVSVLGQEGVAPLPPSAKSHLTSYSNCARKHLEDQARKDPSVVFERIEGSLRPACGSHIDSMRDALLRSGVGRGEVNAIIRSAYAALQPSLRSYLEAATASERDRRQAGESSRSSPKEEAASQDQIKAVERERTKFLSEASTSYDACLASETKSLTPVSNEPAETLTKVIEIKCAELEKRLVGLGFAFYGASKAEFHSMVEGPLEERKKRLVADIVTLRADLAREAAKPPKGAPEASAGSNPGAGNTPANKQP
jgi:hypothetical protein